MEYYAKSVEKGLSKEKIDKIVENTVALINEYDENVYSELISKLKNYLKNIDSKLSDKGQKTLAAHTKEILSCAEKFFDIYGTYFTDKEKYLIMKACEWHDVGKVNLVFQSIVDPNIHLAGDVAQIPHGFLSALSISKKKICAEMMENNLELLKDDFRILVSAIYYHHDRDDVYTNSYIEKYAEKWYIDEIEKYLGEERFKLKRTNRNKLLFSDASDVQLESISISENIWCKYMLVKGMLNKFDWTVSSGYEEAELGVDIFEKKLCKNIEMKMQGSLRPAQEYMKDNSDKNVVVIAPTGSGKTEAALLWLNGDKGFYTLPLRVSANAIYERIKYKYEFENTAILHSNSLSYYSSSNSDAIGGQQKRYERAKLLAYPLTVCTVDQLLKFVYKFPGTEVFAATLKYSKLIVDEIQAYSPKIVAALIYGLTEINKMGGKFAIITATFPPVMSYFMNKYGFLEDRDYVYQDFSASAMNDRHRIKMVYGYLDIDKIVEEGKQKKVLVICNTVTKAQKLYMDIIESGMCCDLLHSRYINRHRRILENKIMDFSKDESTIGIWITTQIVEASLDIDFDVLFTEMATADSLLQRMGRCNRAGYKSTDQPNVYVYVNNSGVKNDKKRGIYDRVIYDRSVETLRRYDGKLMSETDKRNYINEVYDINAIEGSWYFDTIKKNLDKFENLKPLDYKSKKDVDYDFREINSITLIPDDEYYNNCDIIEKEIALLQTPRVDREIRQLIRSDILDRTLSLNLYSSKYGVEGIDTCIEGTNIHRTSMRYEFDEETGTGVGLDLFNKNDEDNFL